MGNKKNNYDDSDFQEVEVPRLEIYKETFGGFENVTDEWYKNNRE